jgi:hypothetical protein
MRENIRNGSVNRESIVDMNKSNNLFYKSLSILLKNNILKEVFIFSVIILLSVAGYSQNKSSFFERSDTLNIKRRNTIYITEGVGAGATLIGLNQIWYADYPRSGFHFYNDNGSWNQMDKFGHAYSAYFIGKVGMDLLAWSGESKKNQLIYGATLGFAFLTTVEIFDGFSEEWGFSPGDVLANALGTGLLIGQELLWDEQRIQYKFSFHTTKYPQYFSTKLGENTLQQIIKDYNGQTYWLSVNLWSFFKESKIPRWLNVAIGYGSEGLPEIQVTPYNYPGIEPYPTFRQFYASIDVDLTKIRTKSPFLKTVFNVFNYLKIPAPTLEITNKGKVTFHPIYF